MVIIGVSGYAKSGKDTIANAALEYMNNLGYNCIKVPFAYKLKKITADKYGIGKTGSGAKSSIERAKFQKVGEEGRTFYNDLWIDLSKCRILEYLLECEIPLDNNLVVIHSDVRHINECKFTFSSKDNLLLCVNSDKRQGDDLNDEMYQHESEIHIPEIRAMARDNAIGVIIYNNGQEKNTLANLYSILYARYAHKGNTKMLDMCKGILWKNKIQ